MEGLGIKEVATRTGIAAGTIRMWEQRYGFPRPARTPSGYRRYAPEDVEVLLRVVAHRRAGLSVPAALDRARAAPGPTDRPSLFAAVAPEVPGARPLLLRKRTLVALSRAIEDEALASAAAPVVLAAFQRERFYRAVEHRYRALARSGRAAAVFADFPAVRRPAGAPAEIPLEPDDALGEEWAVIVDAPGYAACLLGWEQPGDRSRGRPGTPNGASSASGRSTRRPRGGPPWWARAWWRAATSGSAPRWRSGWPSARSPSRPPPRASPRSPTG